MPATARSTLVSNNLPIDGETPSKSGLKQKQKPWIDPYTLPNGGDISHVTGNVPANIKQLVQNTFVAYGVGDDDCFAAAAGKECKFVEANVSRKNEKSGKMECTTVWEAVVSKSKYGSNLPCVSL